MIGEHANEDKAFAEVNRIRSATGHWPGVILHGDGSASLTWRPDSLYAERHDAPGRQVIAPAPDDLPPWSEDDATTEGE